MCSLIHHKWINICKLTVTKKPKTNQPNFNPPTSLFVAIQGDVRKLYFPPPDDANTSKYIRSSGPNPKGLEECKPTHARCLCSYLLLPLSLSMPLRDIKGHSARVGMEMPVLHLQSLWAHPRVWLQGFFYQSSFPLATWRSSCDLLSCDYCPT